LGPENGRRANSANRLFHLAIPAEQCAEWVGWSIVLFDARRGATPVTPYLLLPSEGFCTVRQYGTKWSHP